MALFGFNELQIKDFTTKYIKLLKQDDKFAKDINKNICDAIKEEKLTSISQEVQ